MQQVFLEIVGPVELATLVGTVFAGERACEAGSFLVRSNMAREIAPKVFETDLALVLFF